MTLQELYDQLTPIVLEFGQSVDEHSPVEYHEATTLFCFAMHSLQMAVDHHDFYRLSLYIQLIGPIALKLGPDPLVPTLEKKDIH